MWQWTIGLEALRDQSFKTQSHCPHTVTQSHSHTQTQRHCKGLKTIASKPHTTQHTQSLTHTQSPTHTQSDRLSLSRSDGMQLEAKFFSRCARPGIGLKALRDQSFKRPLQLRTTWSSLNGSLFDCMTRKGLCVQSETKQSCVTRT